MVVVGIIKHTVYSSSGQDGGLELNPKDRAFGFDPFFSNRMSQIINPDQMPKLARKVLAVGYPAARNLLVIVRHFSPVLPKSFRAR
jgi:hypothetical protein